MNKKLVFSIEFILLLILLLSIFHPILTFYLNSTVGRYFFMGTTSKFQFFMFFLFLNFFLSNVYKNRESSKYRVIFLMSFLVILIELIIFHHLFWDKYLEKSFSYAGYRDFLFFSYSGSCSYTVTLEFHSHMNKPALYLLFPWFDTLFGDVGKQILFFLIYTYGFSIFIDYLLLLQLLIWTFLITLLLVQELVNYFGQSLFNIFYFSFLFSNLLISLFDGGLWNPHFWSFLFGLLNLFLVHLLYNVLEEKNRTFFMILSPLLSFFLIFPYIYVLISFYPEKILLVRYLRNMLVFSFLFNSLYLKNKKIFSLKVSAISHVFVIVIISLLMIYPLYLSFVRFTVFREKARLSGWYILPLDICNLKENVKLLENFETCVVKIDSNLSNFLKNFDRGKKLEYLIGLKCENTRNKIYYVYFPVNIGKEDNILIEGFTSIKVKYIKGDKPALYWVNVNGHYPCSTDVRTVGTVLSNYYEKPIVILKKYVLRGEKLGYVDIISMILCIKCL